MLNRIILIGRLTKDPELRYTASGTAVATFTLAVDRPIKKEGQQDVDFVPIVVWAKQAESCANHIGKGRLVAVDGRLQVRTYDAKDGQKKWVTEVIAENVRFLDRKKEQVESGTESMGTEVDYDSDSIPF
ncbi:MAG: single-stranded DNA-binding protein [Peptococcaceae bacterium BICA1-8]|nr:MAG: single-stranded DNA-binding protein [Peptococcaceae bacterium BICA1-8]